MLFKNLFNSLSKTKPADSIRAQNKNIRKDTDLIGFYGSNICPYCSIYSHRHYSLSGRDKRFPSIDRLPKDLRGSNCPVCGCVIGFNSYYPLDIDGSLKKDIAQSNRPFTDQRTKVQINNYNKSVAEAQQAQQDKADFSWISANLPDIAPKSFSGYRRMKNMKSANYLKLVDKAKSLGYIIK